MNVSPVSNLQTTDVSSPIFTATLPGPEGSQDTSTEDAGPTIVAHPARAARQSVRAHLPSVRFHGPEWA